MTTVKRPYDSPRRRAQALATRRRLAVSARRLFAEQGYAATTIESIARDAGLAVQTFYATFGSKRAVLFALLDEMEDAADMHGLIQDLHDAGADSRRQLAALVNFNMRLFEQLSDMFEILRSGAADPDIVSVSRAGDDRRRAGQAPLVRGWAESDALKVGLHVSAAADILWSLTSPELFHLFVVRQQWPTARYASWLTEVLDGILFG
jgi:AcrR family transcriptional regulator